MSLSSAACGDSTSEPAEPGSTLDGGGDRPDGSLPGSDAGPTDPVVRARTARVVSVPPTYALVGESYDYRLKTSTKASSLELLEAPTGMTLRNGMVRWQPTDSQVGTTRVAVRALGAGTAAEQLLIISVARSTLRAEGDVDANGGNVHVQGNAPRRTLGMGMYVPPRSVSGMTRMTVSELDRAPKAPNSASPVRALRFGPTGQVFDAPARVTLGLPEEVTHSKARLGVYVYDPAGRWLRVPMLALDLANGLVSAKAQHFSVYAAIQSSLDMEVTLARATQGACEGSLVGRAIMTSPLRDVTVESVNNLSGEFIASLPPDKSVEQLLALPHFSGSLRAVQVLELVEDHAGAEVVRDRQLLVTTLFVPGDGSATLTHTDALGNVHESKRYAVAAAELEDISARLRGAATAAMFAGDGSASLGLAARMHLLHYEGDATLEPVALDDLGLAAVERAPSFGTLASAALPDGDCDGLLDAFDGSDDSLSAAIDASPSAPPSVFVGDAVSLQARVLRAPAGVTGSWTLLDGEGATLAVAPESSDARVFTATAGGRYLVSFRAEGTRPVLEHVFAIDVLAREPDSTPPACKPSKQLDTGRVGEAIALSAVLAGGDGARSALSVSWGLVDSAGATPVLTSASTIQARGDKALFAPLDAGNFVLGCRAFDGLRYGPMGQVELSVVPRAQNRAPTDLLLTPAVMNIEVGTQLKLHASASDPDGDTLSFEWEVEGVGVLAEPASNVNESYVTLSPARPGKLKVRARVSDGKAPPSEAFATVLVGSAPVTTTDVDKDGWSPGSGPLADCDDNNASVHPTAVDACGDTLDADCDGSIDLDDCDFDDYTVAQGDCDDANPRRHPGATEVCDGIDNDCDQGVDESFSIGKTCTVGVGQCVASGKLECSADGLTQLCATSPLLPTAEVCDQLDNNCNGLIDEQNVCGVDAGVPGTIDAGVLDAGAPTCVNQGAELCTDGADNDCDGDVDLSDKDCQVVIADSCQNPVVISPGKAFRGNFDGAMLDFTSACSTQQDLVYRFTVSEPSLLSLLVPGGAQLSAWSIQQGSCLAQSSQLSELSCSRDLTGKETIYVRAGTYYLVLKGEKGAFEATLNAVASTAT